LFSPGSQFSGAAILDRLKRFVGLGAQPQATGQQRPYQFMVGSDDTLQGRYFDQEIPWLGAVRDSARANQLHEMRELSSEVGTAINMLCDDALSHYTGDTGLSIGEYVDADDKVSIDPATKEIVNRFIYQNAPTNEIRCWMDEYLSTGDCFIEIIFDRATTRIENFLVLPTWEMFRIEDNSGRLVGYQQRRHLSDTSREFHPLQIIHCRYQRKKLYGRALFDELRADWSGLKSAEDDWARACREVGLNPLVHYMPPCADEDYRRKYIAIHKARMQIGSINHYYLDNEAKIENASTLPPSLKELSDRVDKKRRKFFQRARIPPWLAGFESSGAKEIAGLPGESFSRHINAIRQVLSDGLGYAIELELALNGITGDQARFRLKYPEIIVNPYATQSIGKSGI
jgi:hypothetical protein